MFCLGAGDDETVSLVVSMMKDVELGHAGLGGKAGAVFLLRKKRRTCARPAPRPCRGACVAGSGQM
jgi:hypothetical protein